MKNKRIRTAISTLMVMALVLTSFSALSHAQRKLGDVDGDGKITSADARTTLRASVKLDKLTEEEMLAANVDGDSYVTSADARLILRASVKLETLPDVIVGEEPSSEESSSEEPSSEEPSSEEPSSEEPSSEEPSSEEPSSEEPSSEEPSSEEPSSEEPSSVEPSSEPATDPGEAFIPPAENNEFDILRSGTYYLTGRTVDSSGSSDLEIAKTDNSLYLSAVFNNIKIAILTIGDKVYLVNPKKNTYLDLNTAVMKAELSALGLDVNSFANSNSFDFSYFPPLSQATRSERTPEGYVKYVFEAGAGSINVTMDGKTLICLENARDGSVYRIDFYSVTDQVPSEKRELKNLKKQLQTAFITQLLT